jgi:hypothetical protein
MGSEVERAVNLDGWIPSQFFLRFGVPRVRWIFLDHERLLDPFFEQTLLHQMSHPFHHLFSRETSVDTLIEWSASTPLVTPKGFIFHMSRCGSTLISQMLAESERNIVASEPAPLDGVLRAHFLIRGLSSEVQSEWVRAMVGALSQPRVGGEQAFYLKLDCWHTHQIDLVRCAFPDVPLIFVYRDPHEVMVSHARTPAAWTVPELLRPEALRLQPEDWEPMSMDVYCAKALAAICQSGLDAIQRHGGLLVNYSELPEAMFGRLFDHFDLAAEDIPAMRAKAQFNAKSPQIGFTSDTGPKRDQVTERLRLVVSKHLMTVYDQLELARQAQLRTFEASP